MSPSRLSSPARLAALTAIALVGIASPAQATHVHDRASTGISVTGRGYGHGHGLSQWGAQGAALKGLSAAQILAFYYPGLTPATASGNVSVLITEDTTSDVLVSARDGLQVTSLGNHHVYPLKKKGATLYRLTAVDGAKKTAVSYKTGGKGSWMSLRTVPGQAQFSAGSKPITLHLPHGRNVAYRGILRSAAPTSTSHQRDTVNILALDSYLKGVVPREAYASWEPAALQAQAVAARTYAAFERAQPLARSYQICDTSACQVYGGYSSEDPRTTAAIAKTKGEVLTTSDGKPAFTQFSASNGGWMAAGSQPYLVAKQDPYDTKYRGWTATVPARAIQRAFPALGTFQSASVVQRDGNGQWNGRVVSLRLTGSKGSTTVSGDTFRSIFGLMSTWFTLT